LAEKRLMTAAPTGIGAIAFSLQRGKFRGDIFKLTIFNPDHLDDAHRLLLPIQHHSQLPNNRLGFLLDGITGQGKIMNVL
jgi:hypothetical protein